jgi:hypothetical protein
MIQFAQTVAPASEPVTVAELRLWAKLDDYGDDATLTRMLKTARIWVERATGRALITQTWTATLDRWPRERPLFTLDAYPAPYDGGPWPYTELMSSPPYAIRLAPEPIASISSVSLDGTALDSANYALREGRDLRVKRSVDDSTYELGGGIVITFVAGYGAAGTDVPQPLTDAILIAAAAQVEDRVASMPEAALALCEPYRIVREIA